MPGRIAFRTAWLSHKKRIFGNRHLPMIFQDCHPQAPIDQLVQVYRLRHFILPPSMTIAPKPYPARPEQCIAFYIRGGEYSERPGSPGIQHKPRLVVTGQYTELLHRYSATREFLMVQAVFYPGVLHRITGIPFLELQNSFIDLEALFPREGREVMEQLLYARDYPAIMATIDAFIGQLAKRAKIEPRPIDQVTLHMLQHPGKYSMDWYTREACLSQRQFERKCYDYIGVSPKQFAQICRFVQSYDMRQKNPGLDWLSIAVACGYHDYQHLIRDYKRFANDRPNSLFEAESQALERQLGLLK